MDFETGEISESYDSETGENLEISQCTCDTETGETPPSPRDKETGESSYWLWQWRTKPFKIPRAYYTPHSMRHSKKKHTFRKANPQESELITAVIYLLPTMIFFHPLLSVIAVVIELILHNWAHKKNKKLKSDTIYFHQSPLHGIVKEFCAKCKDDMTVNKITKMQDRQNYNHFGKNQLEYLKRVVT